MKTKRKKPQRRPKTQQASFPPLPNREARGRVHLVVLRDASGAPKALKLSAPLFAEPWQDNLAVSAASTAYGVLAGSPSRARVLELAHKALSAASQVGQNALARSNQAAPACRAGCSHCCHHPVDVSALEVFSIVDHIDRHFTPAERRDLRTRLALFVEQTTGLSPAQRYSPDYACPLLVENQCSVYPVRPFTCRGANSLSEKACKDSLHDEPKRLQYVAGDYDIPRYLEPIRAAHAIAAGVQLSLSELHGLDMAPMELTGALNRVLGDPKGSEARWMSGEALF